MKNLETAYAKLLDSLDFDESMLDYAQLERHIDQVTRLSQLSNNSITIYDNFRRQHVWASPNHKELFGSNEHHDILIHPDDLEAVMQNAITCMHHFFIGNRNAMNHKLVREYRVDIKGTFRRVTEQMQMLAMDSRGNIWLTLSIMEISPNQSPPFRVDSKLINFKTGDFITPVDNFNRKSILSEREITILKLIHDGLLSKEISEKLCISVHTVNTHRQRILEKLEVDTSMEAVKYGAALGLFEE